MIDFSHRANNYIHYRIPDKRFISYLIKILDSSPGDTIIDIGAGTGSYAYEITKLGYNVIAVEPETEMLALANSELFIVNSCAEKIELSDNIAQGAYIINAIHHFENLEKAFNEIKRVLESGKLVIATFDPKVACEQLWLFDYWPFLKDYECQQYMEIPTIVEILEKVFNNTVYVNSYEIPRDFTDEFSAAVWGRPEILLDKNAVRAMSIFNAFPSSFYENGFAELENDIETGMWKEKYKHLVDQKIYDCGFRIISVKK